MKIEFQNPRSNHSVLVTLSVNQTLIYSYRIKDSTIECSYKSHSFHKNSTLLSQKDEIFILDKVKEFILNSPEYKTYIFNAQYWNFKPLYRKAWDTSLKTAFPPIGKPPFIEKNL